MFVQGGGCSGFQYGLMIEESGGVGDQQFESNGVRLFVDPVSISYLKGAEVDFVDTITGGGFTIRTERDLHLRLRFIVLGVRRRRSRSWPRARPFPISIVSGCRHQRSSKRDLIVNAFLKQEGHLSADDLVDLIKREDHRISRATVTARCSGWRKRALPARWISARAGSALSIPIAIRGTFT